MNALWLLLALVFAPGDYTPSRHAAFLSDRFAMAQEAVKRGQTGRMTRAQVVDRLATILGECRALQGPLNDFLAKGASPGEAPVLRLVQLHGLLEAYVTANLLALDDDQDARSLARSLEQQIARRLAALTGKSKEPGGSTLSTRVDQPRGAGRIDEAG